MVDEKPNRERLSTQARAKRRKRKRAGITALGAVVLLLGVGIVGTILYFAVDNGVKYVKEYIGPSETTTFYEQYIEPVVVQDPKPFAKISKASPDWTLMTAIWATLSADENAGRFAYTADNREILPVTDVDSYYNKYFGDDVPPKYHTFVYKGATIEYDEANQCFYVPLIALDNVYVPQVAKITGISGGVKLTVNFIPGDGWTQDKKGNIIKPKPVKAMIFTLSGGHGKYIIKSIENGPSMGSGETSSTVSTSSSQSSAAGSSSSASSGADSVSSSSTSASSSAASSSAGQS